MKKSAPVSKRSIVPPMTGGHYTRFLSSTYDFLTKLSGWRRKIAIHALDDLPASGKLLDIGCGTGFLLHLASKNGYEVHGVEPSQGMLKKAFENYSFRPDQITQAEAHQIPLPSESFDIITASGSLIYMMRIQETASEISRLLKRNGFLRIIDHAVPFEPNWTTPFITLFSQLTGEIIHDYPTIFEKDFNLISKKTLGRGGYLQQFDFVKRSY
ncbi:MAG: class I SAM-dependent methyltransferase [Deltaproteobacteria bacterium]|nr:MAG: class I SAM-dependent methyltransferase [Deltaproteobacteria bacterium]